MTLVPFEQYVLAAEKLIAENPLGLKVSFHLHEIEIELELETRE